MHSTKNHFPRKVDFLCWSLNKHLFWYKYIHKIIQMSSSQSIVLWISLYTRITVVLLPQYLAALHLFFLFFRLEHIVWCFKFIGQIKILSWCISTDTVFTKYNKFYKFKNCFSFTMSNFHTETNEPLINPKRKYKKNRFLFFKIKY